MFVSLWYEEEKTMNWIKNKGPFVIIIVLVFWLLFFSLWDVMSDKGWINVILASYLLLLILTVVLIILRSIKTFDATGTLEEFEKTLEGGLFHFKCPVCNGFFAVKKSKHNDEKIVRMNCPDCGTLGFIPPHSTMIMEEEIPEKKSVGINFRCLKCEEGITVWAEGSELHPDLNVHTCPFCGAEQTMKRI